MINKYERYQEGQFPESAENQLWPLYGAGFDNLGNSDQPINVPMPDFGVDELLIRHDACGLCYSDIKVIRLGNDHPKIYRNLEEKPAILGHEVSITVVGVGQNLRSQYQPGDRFILQADIFVDGIGYAYGYEIQGGLSKYNVIDRRVLDGDHGNYLIPLKSGTGYAESALVEPWACVIAAYNLRYRTKIKTGGSVWFVGPDNGHYSISRGFNQDSHPGLIKLTNMDGAFGGWLRNKAKALGIPVEDVDSIEPVKDGLDPEYQVDDIILLEPTIDLIEKISLYLSDHGILAFSTQRQFNRKANIDVGRIHYNRWQFLGGKDRDIAKIFNRAPTCSALKQGGRVFFVGAGGPMGRMHVQHALESTERPSLIVCSDVNDLRLKDLDDAFAQEAKNQGIDWLCVNPSHQAAYEQVMRKFEDTGFDDIILLTPIPEVISDSAQWLTKNGVMNVFAGVARGTTAEFDLNDFAFRDVRVIGHSGSQIDDMLTMLRKVEERELSTNRSVAAVGSLAAAKDGLQALVDASYPGKVIIFPNIRELPLTRVSDLQYILPNVASKLKEGHIWTKEAEEEFLKDMVEG